jgi:hypothetical protein
MEREEIRNKNVLLDSLNLDITRTNECCRLSWNEQEVHCDEGYFYNIIKTYISIYFSNLFTKIFLNHFIYFKFYNILNKRVIGDFDRTVKQNCAVYRTILSLALHHHLQKHTRAVPSVCCEVTEIPLHSQLIHLFQLFFAYDFKNRDNPFLVTMCWPRHISRSRHAFFESEITLTVVESLLVYVCVWDGHSKIIHGVRSYMNTIFPIWKFVIVV